ncbi:hypothetical protein [Paraburkholderia sp. BR10882]|uniref:hypothetical protein n=1 Tax=unclassified Paraburkholderia TaxID=2615204 RepID=UPI0034CF3E2A
MSADHEVDPENLSPREEATRAAEDHWRTPTQRHITITLARLVSDSSHQINPSAAFMAARTGYARSVINDTFAELKKCGVLRIVGKTGRGGSNVYEFDTDALVQTYPKREAWELVRERMWQEPRNQKWLNGRKDNRPPGKLDEVAREPVKFVNGTAKPNLPAEGAELARHASGTCPADGSNLPGTDPELARLSGGRVLEGLGGLTEGYLGADFALQSAADVPGPLWKPNRIANMANTYWKDATPEQRSEARALLAVLPDECRAGSTSGKVQLMARQVLQHALHGRTPEDVIAAYHEAQAGMLAGRKPQWASVHNTLTLRHRSREPHDEEVEPVRYRLDASPAGSNDAVH